LVRSSLCNIKQAQRRRSAGERHPHGGIGLRSGGGSVRVVRVREAGADFNC
jgi:hypothetical protein